MFTRLVDDPETLLHYTWQEFEPYYKDLMKRPLDGDGIDKFLADWSRISEVVDETYSRLNVAITVDTSDAEAERKYHTFLDTIYPKVEEAEQALKQKLLDSGLEPESFAVPMRRMRAEAELFRSENIPLMTQEHKLGNRYDKIIGAQTVEWEGKEITVTQLRPILQSTDRDLREKAWRKAAQRQVQDRKEIGKLWSEFLKLRLKIAKNAGFSDYRSFRWKQLQRFDYSPQDCRDFHAAIERTVLPVAAKIYESRRKRLGVDTLRPWDLDVDPEGKPPLTPFKEPDELTTGISEMFRRLDQTLYLYFRAMVDEDLLDLANRKNKAPGGYCTEFPATKRPFIFMNAVGLHDDVQTLLHESGHAFHAFERNILPYYHQRPVGMEFAEVASMAMELLAAPFLGSEEGAFYTKEDSARARVEHLESSIEFWPYMAMVDAFQHWVYEHPKEALNPKQCNKQWRKLSERFSPWLDWSGLEDILETGWQRKLHIHVAPFYYVEYGMAQLGAVQIWRNACRDRADALAKYKKALALGGSVGLPELFAAAGARFAFDDETLHQAVTLMAEGIRELGGDLE